MLAHLLDRLKRSQAADRIVVCTSTLPVDDPLVDAARENRVDVFRGHPDDVLRRLTDAADAFDADTVVSCTADNPFVDPECADQLVEFHREGRHDFSRIEGLPFGTFSYALDREAMHRACALKATEDTEVWGGYFTDTGLFRTGVLRITDRDLARPEYRLTVDTPEDFEVVERIVSALHREGDVFSLREIVRFLDEHPEVRQRNAHVQQAKPRPIVLREGGAR